MVIFSSETTIRKSKKFEAGIIAFAIIASFLILYFLLASGCVRQVMIYFLILAGLYISVSLTQAGVTFAVIGAILLFFERGFQWPATSAGLIIMLAGAAAVPYYYERLSRSSKVGFKKKNLKLKHEVAALENDIFNAEKGRKALEQEIEKINQLYVLGRELVEHVEIEDVIEHLQRILLNRPGVANVAVFAWGANSWKIVSCSDPEIRDRLHMFIGHQKELKKEKIIRLFHAWEYIPDKTIVFWPVRLENDNMAGVVIVADNEQAPRYLAEGNIFIPQIEMGLERTRLFTEVRERSRVDGLTGLYLRRYFIERLQTEIQRAKRYAGFFSVLILDLDLFKKVNDTYGHLVGDKVLCGVSRIFVDCVKPGDMIGRYGGEEFIILMPMRSKEEVMSIAKEINKIVAKKEFSAENVKFHVTISIGVSHYPGDGTSTDELIAKADQALYSVKSGGRNGVNEYGSLKTSTKHNENKQQS
jgi:diguanylate cyclase (GGDEF)-like protein